MNRAAHLILSLALLVSAIELRAELTISALGHSFTPDPARTVITQSEADKGGSTSIRHTGEDTLEWKASGYFQRNRDLGQVFTAPRDFTLAALVLKTGPSDAAVLEGAPGAMLFVQFLEVTGQPRIHDNGTPPGTDAKHGFSKNHRCDDFITGVAYRPLHLARGGVLPALPPTRRADRTPTGDDSGRGVYLRFAFTGADALRFEKGKRYAFMIGFEEPGKARGLTFANLNAASAPDAPALGDKHDLYPGGWSLRREGDGTTPPAMFPGENPPAEAAAFARLKKESLFPAGGARFALAPTSDGYPDVDTYRDLVFFLEAEADAAFLSPRRGQAPALGIRDGVFTADGKPFQMWGIRVASATASDAQTDHLLAQLDDYQAHGLNAITVFYQGSRSAHYDPFSPDGRSVDAGHQRRMERILTECGRRGMFVIVGIFYQNARLKLRDAEAVRSAVRLVSEKLQPFPNVLINVANEQNSEFYDDTKSIYDFRDPQRIMELCQLVKQTDPQRLVGAGGYDVEKNILLGKSPHVDAVLFDFNKVEKLTGEICARFQEAGVIGKPRSPWRRRWKFPVSPYAASLAPISSSRSGGGRGWETLTLAMGESFCRFSPQPSLPIVEVGQSASAASACATSSGVTGWR